MINFREKSRMFALGLMVGLTVAGGFFVLKLDEYFHKLKSFKPIVTNSEIVKSVEETSPSDDGAEMKKSNQEKVEMLPIPVIEVDSVQNVPQVNLLAEMDSLNGDPAIDTLQIPIAPSEEIIIRKDALIASVKVKVKEIGKDSIVVSSIDSILETVSGIRGEGNSLLQFLDVELWESPLNYKGYKLSKSRLLVYGLASIENIKMYKLDDILYFRNGNLIYQLEISNNFHSYQQVVDPLIIDQLK